MKKMIITIVVLVITGVAALFFYVLTDKNKEVSEKEPYVNYINRDLPALRPAYLRWDEYDKIYYLPDSSVSPEKTDLEIPPGAIFLFNKVIHRNKAVSGVYLYQSNSTQVKANVISKAICHHAISAKSVNSKINSTKSPRTSHG